MRNILFVLVATTFSSCATIFFSNKEENTSFQITANVQNGIVKIKDESYFLDDGKIKVTLPKLSNNNRSITIESKNYDSQNIRVKKTPRILPLVLDVLSIPVTLGIPLFIDVLSSKFYKISNNSKEINIKLLYSQEYLNSELDKIISVSNKPDDYNTFENKYTYFQDKNKIRFFKDSLQFILIKRMNNEDSIKRYITDNPKSNYIDKATSFYNILVKNREDFVYAKKNNTIEVYEKYINNHPLSIYNSESAENIINLKKDEVINKSDMFGYLDLKLNYINRYNRYLSSFFVKDIINKIDLLIENKLNQISISNDYNEISKNWKQFYSIKIIYPDNLSNSYISDRFLIVVSNFLFNKFKITNNEEDQKNLLNMISVDFKDLYKKDFILQILENSNNKFGSVSFYNKFIYPNYFNNKSTININPTKQVKIKNNIFNIFQDIKKQIISFENNEFKGPIESINSNNIKYSAYISNKKLLEEKIFFNNELEFERNFNPTKNTFFEYEYENGINITIQELENKLKIAEKSFEDGQLNESIEQYSSILNNPYPNELPINIDIQNKLSLAQNAKIENDKKEELAAIERQKKAEQQKIENESELTKLFRKTMAFQTQSIRDAFTNKSTISPKDCLNCEGSGIVKICKKCKKTGRIHCKNCEGTTYDKAGRKCIECNGKGIIQCTSCNGNIYNIKCLHNAFQF
jgi:hypothetical protein